MVIAMKWIGLLCTLFFISACQTKPTTPTTTQSSTSSQTQTSSSSQATTTSQTTSSTMSSSEVATQDQANLVGTWQQPNQQLTVDALGNWQLTGNINSSGTLTVAADFEQTKMVKLYGFNSNIARIGTYFIAKLNDDSSKMNFGYLGTFTRTGPSAEALSPTIYQPAYLTEAIDFSNHIIGTWTLTEGIEFRDTRNFNPDGSLDIFSDGRGEALTGQYSVNYLSDTRLELTMTYDETGNSFTSTYTIIDGVMREEGFEDYKWTRNMVPTLP